MAGHRPSTHQLIQWVETIEEHGVNLTSWEIDFIEGMRAKIDRWGEEVEFSDNMAERIEAIYTDRCP